MSLQPIDGLIQHDLFAQLLYHLANINGGKYLVYLVSSLILHGGQDMRIRIQG
jgi:hypothetical protein